MNREKIRMLILLSKDAEEADEIIVQLAGLTVVREKIAYLKGMFDVSLTGRFNNAGDTEAADVMDYYALLSTIINSRWED